MDVYKWHLQIEFANGEMEFKTFNATTDEAMARTSKIQEMDSREVKKVTLEKFEGTRGPGRLSRYE